MHILHLKKINRRAEQHEQKKAPKISIFSTIVIIEDKCHCWLCIFDVCIFILTTYTAIHLFSIISFKTKKVL